MSEYPPRSCGPCPHIAHFENADARDYFSKNTTPEPHVKFKENSNLNEYRIGVNHADLVPDLDVSPVKERRPDEREGKYLGGIPPCQDDKPVENCEESCLHSEPEPESCPCCCARVAKQQKSVNLKSILKKTESTMNAAAHRPHPDAPEPHAKPVAPSEERPIPKELPPCYLPQPNDSLPHPLEANMGAIGPWATGRVDWGPLSGLTGTRPVVDKYSIARFSEGDWRAHNKKVIDCAGDELHRAKLVDWNGRQCLAHVMNDTDKNQEDNTKRLSQRCLEVHRWKCELVRAIAAASEEISFLEDQRRRLKQAASVLTIPQSIAGECIERRTGRLDTELVRDDVEEELIKELALCSELRDIFSRTLKDVEKQLEEDKVAKQKMEFDWSDKKVSLEIDNSMMALNNRSTILLFKPGSVRFPDEQSTPEFWEHFTRETLLEGEATRQRSVTLRGTLDAILVNAARDLRTQADKVELALAKRIACTREACTRLENDLKQILQRLADVEDIIRDLRIAIRKMDAPMKKAQTRLDTLILRPRVENCRDPPYYGLIDEVKSIGEGTASLQAQLNQALRSQDNLMKMRSELEKEIMYKRKTLELDNDRTQKIRSFFPSAAALAATG